MTTIHLMPFQNTLISRLPSAEKYAIIFLLFQPPLENLSFFLDICEYYQVSSNWLSTVFVLVKEHRMLFQNTIISRLSSAEKYAIIFLLCLPPLENLPIFRDIWEYYQGSSKGLSTVFVLVTDRTSYAASKYPNFASLLSREICDHSSFMPAIFRKTSFFLRKYGNIIKVLAMG